LSDCAGDPPEAAGAGVLGAGAGLAGEFVDGAVVAGTALPADGLFAGLLWKTA
jgi:hypothetical protein